jgi:ABC-type transporter Mla maintaining outer membrane lipid asymmetry ATPase subunit MlaF
MGGEDAILEFAGVTLGWAQGRARLERFSARLPPGTLAVARTGEGRGTPPLADAAEGLISPEEGRVRFLGEEWGMMDRDTALDRRGMIGRVFGARGWISNLSVLENISLSARHHTARAEGDILAEIAARARAFGLGAIPAVRPAHAAGGALRVAEWVRAFLGSPRLVLLEHPLRGVRAEYLPGLIGAVREACARGGAVLWVTDVEPEGMPPADRYDLRGAAGARGDGP